MFFLISAISLTMLSGCDLNKPVDKLRAERARDSRGDISVAVVWPSEPEYSSFSKGVDLASDEINLSGGVLGRKIALIKKDDESSVTKGMVIADELSADLNIVAVIGHYDSYVTIPASNIYNSAGILLINPASTSPNYNKNGYDLLFRTISNGTEIAARLVDLINANGCKKIMICYVRNDYGLGLANACEDSCIKNSISVVDRKSYMVGTPQEFKSITEQWKQFEYDCILFFGDINNGANFLKSIRDEGILVPIVCGDAMNSTKLLELDKKYSENIILPAFFSHSAFDTAACEFRQNFEKKYKTHPDSLAALGYDSLKLFAEAVKKAGSPEPQKIAAAMRSFKNEPGATGSFNFDRRGNAIGKNIIIKIIRDRKFVYIDKTEENTIMKKTVINH